MKKTLIGLLLVSLLSGCVNISTRPIVYESIEISPRIETLCTDKEYDFYNGCITKDKFEGLVSHVHEVYKATFTGLRPIATGIVLEDGSVLTAGHVFKEEREAYINIDGTGYRLEEMVRSELTDSVISKIDGSFEGVKIGSCDDLNRGMVLYVLGNTNGDGISVREAIFDWTTTKNINFYDIKTMRISNGDLDGGDSGGAVFALRDGKPELVGMIVTKVEDSNGIGYAICMDEIILIKGNLFKH